MTAPHAASADVVGEFNQCGAENLSVPVTAAGHTWVQVLSVDASSLQNLDALIYRTCSEYSGNSAVDAAVSQGLALVLDGTSMSGLPGAPAFAFTSAGGCETNYSLASGSPVTTGPGGTLTDDSLDVGAPGGIGGYCSFMGSAQVSSFPAGAIPFFTTLDGTYAGAAGYSAGPGRVAFSVTQMGNQSVYAPDQYAYAGMKTYYINALAWALEGSIRTFTTCASEGYKGAQLTWCKNICENGLTGNVLDTWIHRWINRYRDLPYCAVEDEGGGEGNPG